MEATQSIQEIWESIQENKRHEVQGWKIRKVDYEKTGAYLVQSMDTKKIYLGVSMEVSKVHKFIEQNYPKHTRIAFPSESVHESMYVVGITSPEEGNEILQHLDTAI